MTDSSTNRPELADPTSHHSWPGLPVEILPEAGSTNVMLATRARAGAGEQVLITEHQTAGKGRLDRQWQTPPRAALTFSILLRPDLAGSRWPLLPLAVGLGIHDVLARLRFTGPEVGLKWPNDVLVGEQKLCGILCERVDSAAGPAAVIGIGLNVSTTAEELPVQTATSLALVTDGSAVGDRTTLFADLVGSVVARVGELAQTGSLPGAQADLLASYAARCTTIGREVRVELPGAAELVGRAVGVDEHGQLLVRTVEGQRAVGAGDVVHVRPARR